MFTKSFADSTIFVILVFRDTLTCLEVRHEHFSSITTSLSPVILHKLHLQSYAQQQPPSFAIYNVSSSQLSIPAPTFSPATIITISALISTHALSFRQPSTYNIIHHIDIGQQTLELLLHQYMTQLSASSLSTAAKC